MSVWRIVETRRGFYAQYGNPRTADWAPFVMGDFMVRESARFDTRAEARAYIARRKREGRA